MKDFSKLCMPAKIYFSIAVIGGVIALFSSVSIMIVFINIVFAFIWTFVLGWLCDRGYPSISWFLVLLPYIMIFLAMLNIYHVSDEERQIMRNIKLQGPFGKEAMTMSPFRNRKYEKRPKWSGLKRRNYKNDDMNNDDDMNYNDDEYN